MEIKILLLQVRKQTFRVTHLLLLSWQMGVLGLNSYLFEMKAYTFFYSALLCKCLLNADCGSATPLFLSYMLLSYIWVFLTLPRLGDWAPSRELWKLLYIYFLNNNCFSRYKSCVLIVENLNCTKSVKKIKVINNQKKKRCFSLILRLFFTQHWQ